MLWKYCSENYGGEQSVIEIGPTEAEEVTRPGMHAFSDLFTRSSTFIKQIKKSDY